jgi:hypothetical protein
MRFVGNSKISKIQPKPNTPYPLLRLPQEFKDFVGEYASIFATDYEGKQAFLVVLDKDRNNDEWQQESQVMQPVAQPEVKVMQLDSLNDIESRLSALESSIEVIKSLLFQNNRISNS